VPTPTTLAARQPGLEWDFMRHGIARARPIRLDVRSGLGQMPRHPQRRFPALVVALDNPQLIEA
jgi:hypothetical protein